MFVVDAAGSRMKITLNGEPFDLESRRTVSELLAQLEIDARRVAVEHNLIVLKRAVFDTTELRDGDEVEIVNFVGGG
jgi:thiamine biosynthesis protein ThiS